MCLSRLSWEEPQAGDSGDRIAPASCGDTDCTRQRFLGPDSQAARLWEMGAQQKRLALARLMAEGVEAAKRAPHARPIWRACLQQPSFLASVSMQGQANPEAGLVPVQIPAPRGEWLTSGRAARMGPGAGGHKPPESWAETSAGDSAWVRGSHRPDTTARPWSAAPPGSRPSRCWRHRPDPISRKERCCG